MAAKAVVPVTGEVREGRNLGLDVLRVAATVSVLLSHFGVFAAVHWKMPHADLMFIAGPFGLAAFFVLSGFLIGNILLRVVEQGVDFRGWRNFTLRRLLRVHGVLSFGAGLLLALAMTMFWAAFSLHVIEGPIRRFRLRLRAVAADPSSVTCYQAMAMRSRPACLA